MDLATFKAQMIVARDLLAGAKSLAVAAGSQVRGISEADVLKKAKDAMSDLQRRLYEAWVAGAKLPTWDWKDATKTPSKAPFGSARIAQYKDGLELMYKVSDLSELQVRQWVEAYTNLIPLVLAASCVVKARRDLTSGDDSMSPAQWQEMQVCNKLIAEVGRRRVQLATELRKFTELSSVVEKAAQTRVNTLPQPRGQKKRVIVPDADLLDHFGKSYALPAGDLAALTGGERLPRTNFNAELDMGAAASSSGVKRSKVAEGDAAGGKGKAAEGGEDVAMEGAQ
jgi:hypothetical protein